MEISFYGQSCFRIKTTKNAIVTDPYSPETGIKLPKLNADIVTVSHDHYDHNNISAVNAANDQNRPYIITGPGEYEINNVFVYGYPTFHDQESGKERGKNTIYLIVIDDVRLLHLGDLGQVLSDELVSKIGTVDVLFIPVGGKYTIDGKEAVKVVGQIDPKIIIPMHYHLDRIKIDLEPVSHFLENMGIEKLQPQDNLVIQSSSLPEEREVVVLNVRP
jgi:L-ascorbate metabolism protein UlaG (beta-lactamase superfamily)